jgi:biotin carboxyl carrier protein
MQFTAIINGASVTGKWEFAENKTIEAQIEDRKYKIEFLQVEPQVYWLKLGNQSIEVTVTEGSGSTIVAIGGRRITVEIEGGRLQPAARPSSKGSSKSHDGVVELRAPMPGKIVRTLVAKGDTVQANQGLVVVEAMKMQNEIKTPKAGVVTSLPVVTGVAVNAGDILATVE